MIRFSIRRCSTSLHRSQKKTIVESKQFKRFSHDNIDFNDFKNSFRSKTFPELFRSFIVFNICRSDYLVSNANTLLTFSNRIFGKLLANALLRATFFRHFCAGESAESIKPTIQYLERNGIGSILDYCEEATVEEDSKGGAKVLCRTYDYKNEKLCDMYTKVFADCIEAVKQVSPTGFAAVKITALGNPILLERMSNALRELR